jgi:hypothetical protein
MDESGRLERVPGRFTGHLGGRQAPQFLVNHRQQIVGRFGVAALNGFQNLRHFTHNASARCHDRRAVTSSNGPLILY